MLLVGDVRLAAGGDRWCLLAVPFACIGGVLALYVRGMHLNMSGAVGFTALFGVAIMDGVLMVRWISTLRGKAWPWKKRSWKAPWNACGRSS